MLAAAIALAFTACDKKTTAGDSGKPADPAPKPAAVDEKIAIANFKAKVETIGTWIEEKRKSVGSDRAAGMAMVGEIAGKLKVIRTDGLPAELKAAWGEMNAALAEMGGVLKGMPKIDASKPDEMDRLMQDFMPKMVAVQSKLDLVSKKLQEVGTSYGLDMSKVAPSGK